MMRRSVLTRAIAPLVLAVSLVAPADAQTPPPPTRPPDDGLTRDALADPGTPPRPAEPAPTPVRPHTQRTHLDSKDFVSVHHTRRSHLTAKKPTRVAATTTAPKSGPPRRRNPVVRFVYWWNGWVIRTFHTKFGTVLLGTVGAES